MSVIGLRWEGFKFVRPWGWYGSYLCWVLIGCIAGLFRNDFDTNFKWCRKACKRWPAVWRKCWICDDGISSAKNAKCWNSGDVCFHPRNKVLAHWTVVWFSTGILLGMLLFCKKICADGQTIGIFLAFVIVAVDCLTLDCNFCSLAILWPDTVTHGHKTDILQSRIKWCRIGLSELYSSSHTVVKMTKKTRYKIQASNLVSFIYLKMLWTMHLQAHVCLGQLVQ